MEFHNTNWDYVTQFSKNTGAQIVVDTEDANAINQYVYKYQCHGFKRPSDALINPSRNRFVIFAPHTLDKYLILRNERTFMAEAQVLKYEFLMANMKTTWLGRLALWWCKRKGWFFMPDPMKTVMGVLGDKNEY